MNTLTAEEARDLLIYDPETGTFTRKVTTCWRAKKGSVIGSRHNAGYLVCRVKGSIYLLHRLAWLIMTGSFPQDQIDHINGDRSDNRWVNLRSVTHRENNRNRAVRKDSASGVIGVYLHPKTRRWAARITCSKVRYHLGYFATLEEAKAARKNAEKMHGYHENSGRPSNAK